MKIIINRTQRQIDNDIENMELEINPESHPLRHNEIP
jgi:thiamine phosphate synthase YjbQ (UPF0047 family)